MIDELILAAQNKILNNVCSAVLFTCVGFYIHKAMMLRKNLIDDDDMDIYQEAARRLRISKKQKERKKDDE